MSGSASAQARQEGNKLYQSVSDGLAPVLQKSRLQDALRAYNKALSLAANQQEKAAATKNLGLCSEKLAIVLEVTGEPAVLVRHHFQESLQYFNEATRYSQGQSQEWVEGVRLMSTRCWTQLKDRLEDLEVGEKMKGYHANVQQILDPETRGQAFLEIALHYFNTGVVALAKRNFKESLQNLHSALMPLREAGSLGVEGAEAWEEDTNVQTCVAESIQARVTGDGLLDMVIQDEEILNIDVIWEIIDWYKQAILLTRERDIEMEAVACSRLGKVYGQVLKLKNRAKTYLNRCLELANTLVPRNFTSEDWYITATSILSRYQEETVRAEEEKKQKEQEKVKEQIKHLLDPLEEKFKACKGNPESTKLQRIAFVKYVYSTHPPKNPDHKLEMQEEANNMTSKDLQKVFQKAVVHYHPDKVKEEEHGKEWKVLTEEICKRLTNVYEGYKLP